MEAGTSHTVAEALSMPQIAPSERKPRQKKLNRIRKGKEIEEELLNTLESQPIEPSSSNPPPEEHIELKTDPSWLWTSLTDSSINPLPPLFTKDYRFFFLISGSSIRIYSTKTGKIVSTLSSTSGLGPSSSQGAGHSAEITSILINPQNAFQLISASLDGCIKIWDYLEAVLLSTFNIKLPITHMCAHEREPNHVYVIMSSASGEEKDQKKGSSKVYRLLLKPTKATANRQVQSPLEKFQIGKVRSPVGLGISPSGEWLVVIGGPKAYVCSTSSLQAGFTKFISNEPLTCFAIHPTQEYFATGDQKGQIRLWYCLDTSLVASAKTTDKRAQTTMLHWHAHAVSSLAFSSNGAYLLSGGEEAVLVIWQLHTGKKEFVPRVGSPITNIAVVSHENAEEEYLLVLVDGSLVIIASSSLRISKSFAGVKHNPMLWGKGPAPLAVHSLTSTVILPSSHPSSLLVYSPSMSTAISELEVSPTNRVSKQEDKQIISSRVDRVVISHNGQWMATIDGRTGGFDFGREVYLKFWRWDAASSTWSLNSRTDRPHGAHRVVAMEFIPSNADASPYLVTCGEDRNVKTWRIRTIKSKAGKEEYWVCRSTFGYRSKMPSNVVYSPDGSLIAVSYDLYAVIYDVASSSVRTTLTCPDLRDVWHMAFIGETGQYFVITDNRMVHLWDLVALTVRWQYLIPHTIHHIIPHPKQDSFVVMFTNKDDLTAVYKFVASDPSIKYIRTLPFMLKNALWYPFGASRKDFSVIGITYEWKTVVCGDKLRIAQDEESSARDISNHAVPERNSLFQDIFGATAFDKPPPRATQGSVSDGYYADTSKLGSVFDAPSHQLSPMGALYPSILKALLHERTLEPTVEPRCENVDKPTVDDDTPMTDVNIPQATRSLQRALSSEDMQELIELFKGDAFSSKTTTPSRTRLNGNGVSKTTNGVNHAPKAVTPHKTVNGKVPDRQEADETESPASVGKKRKKA